MSTVQIAFFFFWMEEMDRLFPPGVCKGAAPAAPAARRRSLSAARRERESVTHRY